MRKSITIENEQIGSIFTPGDNMEEVQDLLEQLTLMKQVTVWTGENTARRHSFDPAISVCGRLEQHPEKQWRFRIVVSQGVYAYFGCSDVVTIITRHDRDFIDGSNAVITISFCNQIT